MAKIEIERVYDHPREKVWKAITRSEALAAWLMPNDFEARVGHRFTFRTEPAPGFDGIVRCEVRELIEPRRLSFTWRGGPVDTLVTFTLEEVGEGTRLRMVQDGFKGLRAWLVSRMLKSGSRKIYGERLPELLARMRADGGITPPEADAKCMNWRTRWLARLSTLFHGAR